VHTIISNATVLSKHLTTFTQACGATEAIPFERTTFLVIATSAPPDDGPRQAANDLSLTRYERTSRLIKALKHSCVHMREDIHALEMVLPEFTAVLVASGMTRNTYILLIVHDPIIGAVCFANAPCDYG